MVNLKELRQNNSITQEQLAKECGVIRQTISNIECGQTKPSVELARRIANVFGIKWTLFFEEDNE